MVKGLDKFKEYFADFTGNYVIIGGTARDIIMEEAGFEPKGTKDVDMVLIVEALNEDFVKTFWGFIKDGEYKVKEKNDKDRRYYRFIGPKHKEFPVELELFSRNPDLLNFDEGSYLTPIPVDEGLTSLSAILLDDEYYQFMIEHSEVEEDLHLANKEAIICLKAKAFIDMTRRKAEGVRMDKKKIRKHHTDIFRLALTLGSGDFFELPGGMKKDMHNYIKEIANDLPGKELFRSIGVGNIDPNIVLNQIKESFQLDEK